VERLCTWFFTVCTPIFVVETFLSQYEHFLLSPGEDILRSSIVDWFDKRINGKDRIAVGGLTAGRGRTCEQLNLFHEPTQ
jgi:hypothetical protein